MISRQPYRPHEARRREVKHGLVEMLETGPAVNADVQAILREGPQASIEHCGLAPMLNTPGYSRKGTTWSTSPRSPRTLRAIGLAAPIPSAAPLLQGAALPPIPRRAFRLTPPHLSVLASLQTRRLHRAQSQPRRVGRQWCSGAHVMEEGVLKRHCEVDKEAGTCEGARGRRSVATNSMFTLRPGGS